MKTIVVAGAKSRVGKTSLAVAIQELIPGSRYVKIGCGQPRAGRAVIYPLGTSYQRVAQEAEGAEVLIIESNSVLQELKPDVCLYIEGDPAKPSAQAARAVADIVSDTRVADATIAAIASKLGLNHAVARQIAWLTGARPEPAAAIILIGGRSTRMGYDKALLPIAGVPAAQRLYQKLTPHFDEVFFSAAPGQQVPIPGAPCIFDSLTNNGPLSGLATALSASPCRVNFVIACDIPELDLSLIRKLLSSLEHYEIAVPAFTPERTEPLFAAYDRKVGTSATQLLAQGITKVLEVYALHRTRIIKAIDYGWYANLNTPADLRRYTASVSVDKRP